jgi:hypothetical protein
MLWSEQHAVLFKALKKTTINSVVHQWVEETGVGAEDGAWVSEGADSEEGDPTLARKYATAKYLQTLRKTTLQASVTNNIEMAEAIQKEAGTLHLIKMVEKGLFEGNSDMVAEQPDGLVKQILTDNIIDMRGEYASSIKMEESMVEAERIIFDKYGSGSLALLSTKAVQDLAALMADRKLVTFPLGVGGGAGSGIPGGVPGNAFPINYPTQFGNPEIKPDIFIQEGTIPVLSSLTTKVPDICTIGSGAHTASAALSKFVAADAGDYWYIAVGINKYGDGVQSTAVQVTGVAAGDKVTFTITKGSTTPTAYKIYRSKVNAVAGTDCRYMTTVAYTASPQTFTDHNDDLPGCSKAFILTMGAEFDAIEWFQFLPMMKFNLYPTNAAVYPFLMLLFGNLALKKPTQHVMLKNICPSKGGFY